MLPVLGVTSYFLLGHAASWTLFCRVCSAEEQKKGFHFPMYIAMFSLSINLPFLCHCSTSLTTLCDLFELITVVLEYLDLLQG